MVADTYKVTGCTNRILQTDRPSSLEPVQCCGSETKILDPAPDPDPACSKFRIRIRIRILDSNPDSDPGFESGSETGQNFFF